MKEVRLKYLFPASFRTLRALISKFFYTFGKKEVKEEEVFEKMKDKLGRSESTLRNYLNLSVKLHFLDVKDKRYSIREEGVKFDRMNTLEARKLLQKLLLDDSEVKKMVKFIDSNSLITFESLYQRVRRNYEVSRYKLKSLVKLLRESGYLIRSKTHLKSESFIRDLILLTLYEKGPIPLKELTRRAERFYINKKRIIPDLGKLWIEQIIEVEDDLEGSSASVAKAILRKEQGERGLTLPLIVEIPEIVSLVKEGEDIGEEEVEATLRTLGKENPHFELHFSGRGEPQLIELKSLWGDDAKIYLEEKVYD